MRLFKVSSKRAASRVCLCIYKKYYGWRQAIAEDNFFVPAAILATFIFQPLTLKKCQGHFFCSNFWQKRKS
ncbi:MAG: hypothetical protein ABIH08_03100 [Candidatus Omnitrophota bacterium]